MIGQERDFQDPRHVKWRGIIFKRDDYSCQMCGSKGPLEAHHVVRYADNEKLRYVISNGITLCKDCHTIVTGRERDFEDFFKNIIKQKIVKIGIMGKTFNIKRGKSKRPWKARNPRGLF